MLEPDTIILF